MRDCLFCTIAHKEKPATLRYEDDQVVAFDDIAPKATVHILVVPKRHIASTAEMTDADEPLIGHMVNSAKHLAESLGIADDGYRLILNTRAHGGQVIDHIHLHLLGGQPLGPMVQSQVQ